MKVLSLAVLIISLTYFVENGHCGVVDRVKSSVEHGTQAVRDSVNGWWSYGKDFLFGDDIPELNTLRTTESDVVDKPKQGLVATAYKRVVDGYRAVRGRLHDLLIDQENGKDKGIINTMYDRVNKRITQLKSFVFNNDKFTDAAKDPPNSSDMVALRKSMTDFFKAQSEKSRRVGQQVHNEMDNAGNKLKEGFEAGKDILYETNEEVSRRISDGTDSANEFINDKVNNVRQNIGESFTDLQENVDDLTEKEKEVLNAIAARLRDRVSNVYGNLKKTEEDLKTLSYGGNNQN